MRIFKLIFGVHFFREQFSSIPDLLTSNRLIFCQIRSTSRVLQHGQVGSNFRTQNVPCIEGTTGPAVTLLQHFIHAHRYVRG